MSHTLIRPQKTKLWFESDAIRAPSIYKTVLSSKSVATQK